MLRRKKQPAANAEQPQAETTQTQPEKTKRRSARAPKEQAPEPAAEPTNAVESKRPRFRRNPAEATEAMPPAPVDAAAPMAAEEAPPKRGAGRRGGKKQPLPADDYSDIGPDMPVLVWRPRKEQPAAERNEARTEQREARQPKGKQPRKREEREQVRFRERREPEAPREAEKPTIPQRPARPAISIPPDAPQVVLRKGIPTLVRNHRVYPPISFFGSSADAGRAHTVLEEIRLAGEAGVHIHSHLVEFEVDPRNVESAVSFAAYMLNKTVEADPDAQVIFRVVFIAPAGWTEQYPDGKYFTADGALAEPSVSDDDFWNAAKNCLKEFIRMLRLLEGRDHILGVHLERGEWFYAQGWGYDTSNAARQKFREWARLRYGDDVVALRAAWFDGNVSFQSLLIPTYQGGALDHKFIRSRRRERRWVDYHLFLSDAVVERLGDLGYAAKEASEGYFLVGVSYGYTFEWAHPGSGHLSLGKLLRTQEIDFIAGPPSYNSREPGGAAPFPGPIDSFALNGKLYISEEDFKTSIGGRQEPDDFNPVIKTPQALESVHWRGAGSALAHASGVCWMDLWGNGWLKTAGIWDRAASVRKCLIRRMAAPLQEPDVAVFIDERALAYLVDEEAFALLVQNVRESVLRSGLNAAFYLLSDLQHREVFPESKLYVFLNAWDIRPDLRAAIKTRLQRDNKVLFWIFAAGLFDSGRESLERAREVTGIALKPQPFHSKAGTTILNRRHPLCEAFPERGIVGDTRMEPSYFAIPEEATVLGEYTQTGLPSFVVREFKQDRDPHHHWSSVFLGEPIVTPALLRALAQMAGVHVWGYQDDVVHVRPPFLAIHCTGAGSRTVTLPSKWHAYNLDTDQWLAGDSSSIRFQAADGSTHLFLAGTKEELEHVLSADTDELLHMEELPPRKEDNIRFDAATFDVPIMKLDEWMEGGDLEDTGDDLLFRPKFIEEPEPAEEQERSGRRRRRRGRGRDAGGEDTGRAAVRAETMNGEDDVAINVVFRRRQ